MKNVGAVVIGRNEGERLQRCLRSLHGKVASIVYVDSGSTDGSSAFARGLGVTVVDLDATKPFTAARARNAGFQRLATEPADVELVQFVDGDCEVVDGWLHSAAQRLRDAPGLAAVCGRRRERFPERSVYNRLCDIEWDTPVGDARACGGDAMIRVRAFRDVGGYADDLIAGEEPELCVRLRGAGWKIERMDHEMTLHDAAMTTFEQWWRRATRSGYAYAEGASRLGRPPERHFVRETRRALLWGGIVPVLAIGGAVPSLGASTLLLLGYPVSGARAYSSIRRRGRGAGEAALYAVFCTLGKLPELQGVVRYHRNRVLRRRSQLIEYK
ncbi:MAG: glycosyl transferase [Deltaproteobacteria bacterium RBG_16_71_12]|nr:MAG: glycosyl transferase [Deltaproteobacteria bacterium RBG_16_71_12]